MRHSNPINLVALRLASSNNFSKRKVAMGYPVKFNNLFSSPIAYVAAAFLVLTGKPKGAYELCFESDEYFVR